MTKHSWIILLLKYFIHGIMFSILILALMLMWAVAFVVLVIIGLFIGLIIGLLLLFFIVGGLNVFLTKTIWSVSIKSDWKNLLLHGLILIVLLFLAEIPGAIISYNMPDITVTVAVLVVNSFIYGLIAKRVANFWKEERKEISEQV